MPQALTEENWNFDKIIETLVMEDDEPVDNIFSAKHQRLFTETLYSSWKPLSDEEHNT